MKNFLFIALVVMAASCAPQPEKGQPSSQPIAAGRKQSADGGTGKGGITPIGPNVGAMTPVGGTESLDNPPSGALTNAIKSKAHDVAGQASTSSTPETTSNDE
jgi:hypothetical protein